MRKPHPGSICLSKDDPRAGVLRFSWPYTLSIGALHELCCGYALLAERLAAVDSEYYELRAEDFPDVDDLRAEAKELRHLALPAGTGRVDRAALAVHLSSLPRDTLEHIAQLLWSTHREFAHYMQGDLVAEGPAREGTGA